MLGRLFELLGGAGASTSSPEERIEVAVAVILLEMAHADGELEPLEQRLAEDLLQRQFHLGEVETAELLELAQRVRQESFDLQQFTSRINEHFSREDKFAVMETLWRIVYADQVLNKFEDALARQLAGLLRLSHREAIALKLKVLDESRPED